MATALDVNLTSSFVPKVNTLGKFQFTAIFVLNRLALLGDSNIAYNICVLNT